jgi:hypothetical protein
MEPLNKKRTETSRCGGDGPRALSVAALRVWLGQDRLSSMLASGAMLGSEWHPIPRITAGQQKICYFHMRFKLMQRTAREGMNRFHGDKVELRGVSENPGFRDTLTLNSTCIPHFLHRV